SQLQDPLQIQREDECGTTPEDAVYAYRVIWYYTADELTVRFNRERHHARLDRPPHRDRIGALAPEEFPLLTSLGPRWVELTTEVGHRRGPQAVLEGLPARTT
ncbi:hypothetical protein HO151_03610, partial [Streptomyces sp. 8P21H-1]|nr:hypothetical protein [Streptomyces sp. 8P21H-1]